MIQLRQLIPKNYLEEKSKFFSDTSYNPQFQYDLVFSEPQLTSYGIPEDKLVDLAQIIITIHMPHYLLSLANRENETRLDKKQITLTIEDYLDNYNLRNRYSIEWSDSSIARCSIKKNSITLRTNADFTASTLRGALNHEIGTHALRRINDENQPWHGKKSKYGFKNALLTEEGLASLHQLMEADAPIAFNSAVRYLAVSYALSHSFVELWDFLIPYVRNEEKRWMVCFRAKRGLADTSQSGGYTKDMVYFEGMHTVALWLKNHDFNPASLYLGKISCEDMELATQLKSSLFTPTLPVFYTNDPEDYKAQIQRIIDLNMFEEI